MSYTNFRDLASLTSDCAVEMDRYVQGLAYDSKPLERFKKILSNSQLKDTDNFMTVNNEEFYLAIYKVAKKDSDKELRRGPDLALEMRLLRMELDGATDNKERGVWAR